MRNQFPDRDNKTGGIEGKLRLNGFSCKGHGLNQTSLLELRLSAVTLSELTKGACIVARRFNY